MPLPAPTDREHLHTRTLDLRGYARSDGLFDIEGRLTDTKGYAFQSLWRGEMKPGMAVHGMALRLTLDDTHLIREVEACIDDSPFEMCPQAAPNFKALVGIRMGPGWRKKARELLGGTRGCTHLLEMLGQMATVAFQTIHPYKMRTGQIEEKDPARAKAMRSFMIDSCLSWDSKGPVVRRLIPDAYTGDDPPENTPGDSGADPEDQGA
ncbi:MAG: DUF2889 domain-containing protein [Deltaproteobacteria bacterium]|nr:DUF2889 domain-containing protein [Deltaproteobacteria bacterium]